MLGFIGQWSHALAASLFAAFALWNGAKALGNFQLRALVTAALCVYFIAYRFYSKYIAEQVLQLDDSRPTPAVRHNDGMDYVPTNKWVLYGHHFAAIAGAGPLVGPVLAAQMGYLPGTIWLLAGVIFIVAGLTFFPALALGPIVEHFAMTAGTVFSSN